MTEIEQLKAELQTLDGVVLRKPWESPLAPSDLEELGIRRAYVLSRLGKLQPEPTHDIQLSRTDSDPAPNRDTWAQDVQPLQRFKVMGR